MIKATEAREITEQAIKADVERRTAKANAFCVNLSSLIEARAKERFRTLPNIAVDPYIRNYVWNELADNGYRVEKNESDGTLNISW